MWKNKNKGEMNRENVHDKEELWSVRTTNEKIRRKVTPLSSGGLMGERGNSQWELRRSGTTCVVKGSDGNRGDVAWFGRGG